MKTIERLLQEYKIRFRDTELIKRDGYPFEDRYISNYSEGGYEPIVCESEVWNINGQVYGGGGKWATADLKEKPDNWVVERDESHPVWEKFVQSNKFDCCEAVSVSTYFGNYVTTNRKYVFGRGSILDFKDHQYLTLDQWAQFFLLKVDFSILNDTDWFYVKTIEEREWVGKGNIIEHNTDKGIHYCITSGYVYRNSRQLINEGDILLLRKATPEDLAPMFEKYPELTPPKVGDWGIFWQYTRSMFVISQLTSDSDTEEIQLPPFIDKSLVKWNNFHKIDITKPLQQQIDEFLKQQTK